MYHTLHAEISGAYSDWDFVKWRFECPWGSEDPRRDCRMEGSDECGAQHWLEHGGPEGLRVEGPEHISLPAKGTVHWEDEDGGPIFEVAEPSRHVYVLVEHAQEQDGDGAVYWVRRVVGVVDTPEGATAWCKLNGSGRNVWWEEAPRFMDVRQNEP